MSGAWDVSLGRVWYLRLVSGISSLESAGISYPVSCPDLSSVLGVILKVLVCHHPVLIADQTVSFNPGGIEFHLELHVFGNRKRVPPISSTKTFLASAILST